MTRGRRWVLGLGLVGILAILPLACNREHVAMGDDARKHAHGLFTRTRDGVVHYELAGPEAGPRVVLVHGVSGPMAVWDQAVPRLVQAGFRVLRYDHFGRGYSDRRDVDHDEALYERQLSDLLDSVGWREPVAAIGSSMGAIVAAGFATAHPERVSRVILVGPAGFPIEVSFGAKLLGVPGLGSYLMSVFGDRILSTHHRKYFVEPDRSATALQSAFEAQLEVEGTKRSIRSTMHNMPVADYHDGYQRLGRSAKPVLLVWGRLDKTFPFTHHEQAIALMPQATLVPIDDAAHLPQFEQADAFARAVIAFLHAKP